MELYATDYIRERMKAEMKADFMVEVALKLLTKGFELIEVVEALELSPEQTEQLMTTSSLQPA